MSVINRYGRECHCVSGRECRHVSISSRCHPNTWGCTASIQFKDARFCGGRFFTGKSAIPVVKTKRLPADRDTVLQPIKLNSKSELCFDFTRDAGKYEGMAKKFVPRNTKKNNDWAYKNFESWH